MQQRTLGSQGLGVSAIGLGCMVMSQSYGPADEQESLATIHHALDLGITFLDTADMYGPFTNERLVGRAIAGHRDEVVVATKFGNQHRPDGSWVRINGRPEYVRSACDASLERLGVDHIAAFAGFRFPADVIVLAVRWYLRFTLSYRDVEELLAERGIEVDHVTVYRWVQRFIPILADAARPCRHAVGDRWQVDETYVKVAGQWRYVYRAVDQFGQVIDVFVSVRRDATAAHRFFQRAIAATKVTPVEVTTDQAPVYPAVLEERLPAAWHRTDRYANNRVECDHGRLKARLGPMRGLKQDRSARVVIAGHALVQNIRRGHYELALAI